MSNRVIKAAFLTCAIITQSMLGTLPASASDHDDGESSFKARNLNLTDLYVFREDWQDSAGSAGNLIFVMNSNPRSLAQFQYEFNQEATHNFHIARVNDANKATRPNPGTDALIQFMFGTPDQNGRQTIRMLVWLDGAVVFNKRIGLTTTLADGFAGRPITNSATVRGETVRVFAGLREDPFFFDVERYFRIRSFLATGMNSLGAGPTQGGPNPFRSNATAVDFTVGYNVNSIVASVPLSILRKGSGQNVFDIWETIAIPSLLPTTRQATAAINQSSVLAGALGSFKQIERLARPAINEGLVLSNRRLDDFNRRRPHIDLTNRNSGVLGEAVAVLTAVNGFAQTAGLNPASVANVAEGFLPDVMRIDTSNTVAIGTPAYNSDFVLVAGNGTAPMLTGGRKIEDDVVDITLSYLLNGDPSGASVGDGITYAGGTTCASAGTGSNPGNPGHRCLHNQQSRLGSAAFPFLAAPQ